jgi:hypothetical protein
MVNRPEGKLMKDENEQGPASFLRKESKIIFDRISASIQTLTPEQSLDTLVEDAGAEEKLLVCEQVAWRSRCRRSQNRVEFNHR